MDLTGRVRLIRIYPPTVWLFIILLILPPVIFLFMKTADEQSAMFYGYPLKGIVVAIDPGHGGIDPGTHFNDSFTEKDIVLDVGLRLRRLLEQAGAKVVMTRERDEDTSHYLKDGPGSRYYRDLFGRVKVINESKADFFLSLHVNSIYDPTVRGAIVYYCDRHPQNLPLAEAIQEKINPVVKVNPQREQYIHQNIKIGQYHILRHTDMPGAVVEMGFLTSPDDRYLLRQDEYRQKLAQALFTGVIYYVYTSQDQHAGA